MPAVMSGITKRRVLQVLAGAPFVLRGARGDTPLIDWSDAQQTIDGFGASASFHQARNLQTFPKKGQQTVLDLLFSTKWGAGLSITRNIVGDGGVIEDGSIWGKPFNGPTPSIEPKPGVWNWKGDEEQVWFMREAMRRGCGRHLSTVWSPPFWMKDNNSVIHGGRVKPEMYRAFAEYLSAYVRGYKHHHGIDIYAVSPTNEPDINQTYSSCLWSGEELRALVRDHIAPVFARDKVAAKLLLGEHSHWTQDPFAPSLADPVAAARVDICAAHAYTDVNKGYETLAFRTGDFPLARAAGKPIWQTEVACFEANDTGIGEALYWAQLLHTHLVENQVSAWFYWWAVAYGDRRGALIDLDLEKKQFVTAKRLFAMGNWSRFVRPGFRRVSSQSEPAPGAWLSAFRKANACVAVAVNQNERPIPLSFPAPGSHAACYRTSAKEELAPAGRFVAANGILQTTLSPRSITTFVLDAR
jgi:glucuronoarabinoxylan endo-1,4-beta-xylanase